MLQAYVPELGHRPGCFSRGVSPPSALRFSAERSCRLHSACLEQALLFELRVAPVGLYPNLYYLTQGLVALSGLRTLGFGGVAPVGLYPNLYYLTQGLVALAGLRTLGFRGVAPLGLCSFYFG